MRNLKKFLALVLAMMMVFSLMLTANATDFVDDANVSDDYRQAVEVLTGLGVLQGDADTGELRPSDPISRAEFAVILYRLATGDTEGTAPALNAMANVDSAFTDVNDANYGWAAKWINYANSMGWLIGNGDGTYSPEEYVTVYQVLIGMLRVVGEDDDITGENWEFETGKKATEIGLADNISTFLGTASREVVGQLAFDTMIYTPTGGTTVYVVSHYGSELGTPNFVTENSYDAYFYAASAANQGDRVVTVTKEITDTLFNTAFGGEYDEGVIIECAENDPVSLAYGTVTIAGTREGVYDDVNGLADLGLVGHKVNVFYFIAANGDAELYALVDEATLVKEANIGSSSTLAAASRSAGFRAGTSGNAKVGYNYAIDESGTLGLTAPGGGTHVLMISNSANLQLDYVIQISTTIEVVENVISRTVDGEIIKTYVTKTGNADTTNSKYYVETDVITTADTLVAGDVIRTMEIDIDNDGVTDLTHISEPEILTGAFNGETITRTARTYSLGGVSYTIANGSSNTNPGYTSVYGTIGGVKFEQNFEPLTSNVGKIYNFVLDDFNRIAVLVSAEAVNSRGYAFLAAFGQSASTDALGNVQTPNLLAQLYFPDGTSEIVELDVTSQTNAAGVANAFYQDSYVDGVATDKGWEKTTNGVDATQQNLIFAVEVQNDGTYLLTVPGTPIDGSTIPFVTGITTNVVAGSATNSPYYANSQSVTFAVTGTYGSKTNPLQVNVINGTAGLIGQTVSSGYGVTVNGVNIYTVGLIANPAPVTGATVYYYGGTFRTVYDGTQWVTTYTVYLNGEATTITKVRSSLTAAYQTPGLVVVDDTGEIKGYSYGAEGVVSQYYQGYLTVLGDDGVSVYAVVVSDAEIYDISDDGFGAFDDPYNTVFVSIVFESVNGVATARQIYVTDVLSNDSKMAPLTQSGLISENDDKSGSIYATVTNSAIATLTTPGAGTIALRTVGTITPELSDLVIMLPDGATLYFDKAGNAIPEGTVFGSTASAAYKYGGASAAKDATLENNDVVYIVAADGIHYYKYTITVNAAT